MKKLIAYYSRADENYFGGEMRYIKIGNTEKAAMIIKELIDADIYKIEQKTPYSANYKKCIDEAKKDLLSNARPELIHKLDNIDEYDEIYLGYPNYWGTMPMAVYTFLESFDFSSKTIHPFCTNEGSGLSSSESDIRKCAKGSVVEKGLSIIGSEVNESKNKIVNWLNN